MSVKRYEWVACDEHSCHCDVVESAEGDMVDYEDYAALEARCAALAAENAVIKECNTDIMKHVYRSKTYLESSRVVDAVQGLQCAIERKSGKSTATDAFLAEVRAQGVEQLALHMELNGYSNEAAGAREYAAQLRKGVQS